MRLRLGLALLALAAVTPGAISANAAPAATVLAWPAVVNIVVDAPERQDLPPTYRLESFANGVALNDTFTIDGVDLNTRPELDCQTEFVPRLRFQVDCRPKADPPPIVLPATNEVVNRAWQCWNAAVKAEITGPMQGEAVTGAIVCGEPQGSVASCTATANTASLPAGWSGQCVATTNANRLPIRCMVDLTKVFLDTWRVTCYSTDP